MDMELVMARDLVITLALIQDIVDLVRDIVDSVRDIVDSVRDT